MKLNLLHQKITHAYHHHKITFFKFLLTGLITTILYFSLFAFLTTFFHLPYVIAATLTYIVAASFHFFSNRCITFKIKNKDYEKQIFRYFTLLILNYVITILFLKVSLLFFTSPYLGLILACGITTLTGYILSKYWIFKTPLSA